jgi:hypothetical protein
MLLEIADLRAAQAPLIERIAELEKQNAELREALECLAREECRDDDDPVLAQARDKARAALASSQAQQKGGV